MLLGCIADDLTGATDLALMLTRSGMRTVQVMGVPAGRSDFAAYAEFDAVVVALKSRTNPAEEAVAWSLQAADALLAAGAQQLFFKYCSTFDSTDQGNIGPVAEALLERLRTQSPLTGAGIALVCPAFPANKRSIYMGNLFVGDVPLAESPMKDHPLTPMRDSNLARVLQRQTRDKVGGIAYPVVANGPKAIEDAFVNAAKAGIRFVVVDAISDQNLIDIGTAAAGHRLITGGSGIAMGLPGNFIRAGLMRKATPLDTMSAARGRRVILAGSCSAATRGQIETASAAGIPALRIEPLQLAEKKTGVAMLVDWALRQPPDRPCLIYSSDTPEQVAVIQARLGRDAAGHMVEAAMAATAVQLVAAGVTGLIVAGGETSGAVVGALGVTALEIGPEIDPGVPWTRALDRKDLVLALKSGNFGAPDFFIKAWDRLT